MDFSSIRSSLSRRQFVSGIEGSRRVRGTNHATPAVVVFVMNKVEASENISLYYSRSCIGSRPIWVLGFLGICSDSAHSYE